MKMGQRQQPSDNKKRWDWSWSSGIGIVALVFVLLTGTSAWAGPNKDLVLAIMHCDLTGIRQALANGADINHSDHSFTPLYFALDAAIFIPQGRYFKNVIPINDPMEVVKFLLDHGANPNARWGDEHFSALSMAGNEEGQNIPLVKLLLAHGAVPTQWDIDHAYGISKVLMERAVLGP